MAGPTRPPPRCCPRAALRMTSSPRPCRPFQRRPLTRQAPLSRLYILLMQHRMTMIGLMQHLHD